MSLVQQAKKYEEYLDQKIEKLNMEIDAAPEGTICINKSDNHYKWFVKNRDGSRRYIPKKQRDYATELAVKSFNKKCLSELSFEKKIVSDFVDRINKTSRKTNKLLFESEELGRLISEGLLHKNCVGYSTMEAIIKEWQEKDFSKNEKYPEKLNVKVTNNLYVRSKSEAFIAMELIREAIPFRYECEMVLDDVSFYSDFTIMHPATGEIILWEHFGMVDSPEYRKNMLVKLDHYMRNGFVPSKNLIVTCESADSPLDFENVRAQIEIFFN